MTQGNGTGKRKERLRLSNYTTINEESTVLFTIQNFLTSSYTVKYIL